MNILFVSSANREASSFYKDHNEPKYGGDSGVDLVIPETITVPARALGFVINHQIACALKDTSGKCLSYLLLPRSSIGKTPLRLSNSVGLIDSGYRGAILAQVDNLSDQPYTIEAGRRLFQLCAPNYVRPTVVVTESLPSSDRGEKGLGSTGK